MSDFSNNSGNQNRPPLTLNAFDEIKLRLFAEIPGSKRKATLRVSVAKNQPRLTVYTNVEGDHGKGIIHARMDTMSFSAFLVGIEEVLAGKMNKFAITSKRPKEGGSYKDLIPESNTHCEREADGRIYIAVTNGKATSVKFYFLPTDFHSWKVNGETPAESVMTEIYAKAWQQTISKLLPAILVKDFVENEKFEPKNKGSWNGNQGGGGGKPNWNGGNRPAYGGGNNNYSKPAASGGDWNGGGLDDDIPL